MTQTPHVVVLGGGIIGVTSAYHLARSGCRVTLVERQDAAGMETSFANGGLVTPSMSAPWASPGLPRMLLKYLGREGSPFLVRPSALPGLMSWGLAFLAQCTETSWRRNMETTLRLCQYSREALGDLVDEVGIRYDANDNGTLHLFRDELSMQSTKRSSEIIGKLGVRYRVLDADGCAELEPALGPQIKQISGGIHYPGDEAGDAHKFTQELARFCAANGVDFRYGESVQRIEVDNGAVCAIVTDKERLQADTCLIALGNQSAALVKPLGVRLPIYPVKGYSLTFPVGGWNGAPAVPFVDDGRKMGIVRMGDRVRVAGTAEFTGYDKTLSAKRIENLRAFFFSLFPDYPHREDGEAWTGLRPTTPEGVPYLGQTPVQGLYLNTGHGHLGWTMSCGSAKVITDIITGKDPAIDLAGMLLQDR